MQQLQPCADGSPWWLAIAATIVGTLCAVIGGLWTYIRSLQRDRTKDLHRVIGWPVSGAPPTPAELARPPVVRPRETSKRKPNKPP